MLLDIDHRRERSRRPKAIPRVYKKAPPSELMTSSDGRRRRCSWLDYGLTIHSDGNVSCGLDDPHAERSFGNIADGPIEEIFNAPEYGRVRQKLWEGHRCTPCSLYEEVEDESSVAPLKRPRLPTTLIVEPSVRCNIACDNGACSVNNDRSIATREADDLDLGLFGRVVEEIGPNLERIFFFNYGDPFMHRSAEDMLAHLRECCPHARIVTSTNGIPLVNPARASKVVASRLDQITFTISGMTQESYARYHANGKLDQALQGLRNVCEARDGTTVPRIEWRYLVFNWNDSSEEIDEAIALSKTLGVDRFTLMVTHIPPSSSSLRLAPGTAGHQRYKEHIELAFGYTNVYAPDDAGFYTPETLDDFGPARWTGERARLQRHERAGTITLSIGTLRAGHRPADHGVLIRTPWEIYRVHFEARARTDVTIPVPETARGLGPFTIELMVDETWSPFEETGSDDRRSLGLLVLEDRIQRNAVLQPASPEDVARFALS